MGQLAVVNFQAHVGQVDAGECGSAPISGIGAQGDHLLLTPSAEDASPVLDYSISYQMDSEAASLNVCNHNALPVNEGDPHFSLLIFDAQQPTRPVEPPGCRSR